jgi:hypothetical protein
MELAISTASLPIVLGFQVDGCSVVALLWVASGRRGSAQVLFRRDIGELDTALGTRTR